ncbi:unnamed protein product [Strongylus vulgaris]|uniref:Uncharacterized protein n=1 Tax=Strongylus vulgaris TaxID=40348 RepID=A0A3P7IV77_STRVU|nr:unnamed protein product [Strongylus vulgaris]
MERGTYWIGYGFVTSDCSVICYPVSEIPRRKRCRVRYRSEQDCHRNDFKYEDDPSSVQGRIHVPSVFCCCTRTS